MGQTRAQTLSDWKGLADAEAGRNAVFAAMLARGGLTGPAPIFEGRRGFFQLVSGPADVDVGAFGRRGVPFRIHQCGMKAYPAVVYRPDRDRGRRSRSPRRSGDSRSHRRDRDRDHPPRPPAGRERTGEMGAGHQGDRGSQPALHHGARHVRRRHQQRQLRAGKAARSAHPRLHAQDHREGGSGLRHARPAMRRRRASPRSSTTDDASSRQVDNMPGFRRAADEPRRRRAEIPQQCRQALAARSGRTPSCRRCGRSMKRAICRRLLGRLG